MSKRAIQVALPEAINRANSMSREEFKAVKHMNKIDLVSYMEQIFKGGYEAGYKAGLEGAKEACDSPAKEPSATQEDFPVRGM